MQNKNILQIALVTALILLVPLVAMQFTDEVSWDVTDFVVMGALLFGTGLALHLVIRKTGKYRVIAALAIVIAFLWLWVELAVGLFTNWGS
jgi:peptidoglycan/LPS O-acetylase OafA/YrhL